MACIMQAIRYSRWPQGLARSEAGNKSRYWCEARGNGTGSSLDFHTYINGGIKGVGVALGFEADWE
jgi:hypothetical protein